MNKKVLFVIIGLVLLIGGAFAYVILAPNNKRTEATMASDTIKTESQTNKTTEKNNSGVTLAKGSYIDYSEQALANAVGTKLLFFHAPWCPQCRSIEASITENGIPDGVTVLKVDYDTHQDLRQKYGVTIQTTFVKVDDNNQKIDSYVAYDDPVFSSVQKALLP